MKRLIVVLCALILSACVPHHLYHYYDYEEPTLPFGNGFVWFRLVGDWKEVKKNFTERTNPYRLSVVYFTHDKPGGVATVEVRELEVGSSKVNINRSTTEPTKNAVGDSRANSDAGLLVEGLQITYVPVVVRGSVSYGGLTKNFEITLRPKYSEEYRNDFWDGLMGI